MIEDSRTKNSIRNIKTGAIVQFVNKVMVFIVRTVFIKVLNTEYLGVNGLFTNILTILSFAELGIGTAIIFNMYRPIANKDKEKIKSLMCLYRRVYNIVGVTVFILGLCVIPFMNIIIKDAPNIKENLILIYVLFLLNTSISYFFTYKKSIISAHQKQSIIDNIDSVFYLCKSIIEIIILIITRNFIAYLLIEILSTFCENLILSLKANKMYPYLKEKDIKDLEPTEKRNIFKNVRSLFIYKLGGVIMSGTDNILISSLINISTVGYCSNYVMIINSVKSIIASALNGITASVGNLNVVGDTKQKESVFYQITFMNYIVYSFCAIAFIVLLNPFISIWLGNEYILEIWVPVSLALSFFIEGLRNPGYTYRITIGLFGKGKITPYIGAITNIILSIILCKLFGVVGIFIATSIAQLLSYSWIDPYLIHKWEFNTPFIKYIKRYIAYIIVFIANAIFTYIISSLVVISGVLGLLIKVAIVCIVPNVINLISFCKMHEFHALKEKISKIVPFRKIY